MDRGGRTRAASDDRAMGDDSIFVLREFVIADRLDDIVEDGKDLVFKDQDGSEKVWPPLLLRLRRRGAAPTTAALTTAAPNHAAACFHRCGCRWIRRRCTKTSRGR